MNKILKEMENWFSSDDYVKISINHYIDDFEKYPIDKNEICFKESVARDKLITTFISSYFKNIEQYLSLYDTNFNFSNYSNFKESIENLENKRIVYFLKWLKNENMSTINEFVSEAKSKEFNLRHLYDVIKYYDFLIRNSFKTNNYDATLDFLIGMIKNVTIQTKELTLKENSKINMVETSKNIKDIILGCVHNYNEKINLKQIHINSFEDNLESANKQTFFIKKFIFNY